MPTSDLGGELFELVTQLVEAGADPAPRSPEFACDLRFSLLHRQGRTWAEIGRLVGQRKLSITADTYTHVLSDGAEISLKEVLER